MARTTDSAVRATVSTDSTISTAEAIATATALTDHVETKDSDGVLSDTLLERIELYLAAHFYALKDPQYKEKWNADTKAVFHGFGDGTHLEDTPWGRQALVLDVTGTLSKINQQAKTGKKRAKILWMGKRVSEQECRWWE